MNIFINSVFNELLKYHQNNKIGNLYELSGNDFKRKLLQIVIGNKILRFGNSPIG